MADKNRMEELDPVKIIEEMREEYWRGLSQVEEQEDQDRLQVLVMEVSGEKFALDTSLCRTIVKAGNYTRLPRMPDFFLGVINLRGEIIPVVDLGIFLNLPPREPGPRVRLVVVEHHTGRLAFRVNQVAGIEWVSRSRLQEPRSVAISIKTEYLKGHIAPLAEEGWITYLDLDKILQGPELSFQKK